MLVYTGKLIGAGLSSIGLMGASVGLGVLFGCYLISLSRNPGLSSVLFSNLVLGFALIEAMALFSLLMSFMILFAF